MNTQLEYNAGAVTKPFLFQELRKYLQLRQQGKTIEEIKKIQDEENVFMTTSKNWSTKVIGAIRNREKVLTKDILNSFFEFNISDQKIINLLSIMLVDRLFFEYMYEEFRENIILGLDVFEDKTFRIYFKNKSEQSEKVASFKTDTIKRVTSAYKLYLKESNLITKVHEEYYYKKPVLDIRLEALIKEAELMPYLKAILGEK